MTRQKGYWVFKEGKEYLFLNDIEDAERILNNIKSQGLDGHIKEVEYEIY